MNDLAKDKTMTIKEIAEGLNCSVDTIQYAAKKVFPNKMKKGITTYFNEKEVTKIKLELDKSSNFRNVTEVKTNLEKKIIVKQALEYLNEEIEDLKTQLNNQKPKVETYNHFLNGDNYKTIAKTAKALGTGQNKLFSFLREKKILMKKTSSYNLPYQKYINKGYFVVKETPITNINKNHSQTYVTPKGEEWISKLLRENAIANNR